MFIDEVFFLVDEWLLVAIYAVEVAVVLSLEFKTVLSA